MKRALEATVIGGTFAVLSVLCMWCVVREVWTHIYWIVEKGKEIVS